MGANAVTTVPTYTAGEVLLAADLNITNSGVPVFAGTSERDAAFGGTGEKTLAEGQLCYLESTNVVQYYDGAAWATVGPQTLSSGMNYITGAAFSAVTSVSLPDSTFTSTYRNYKVIYQFAANTANSAVTIRMRASGTDATGGDYYNGLMVAGINGTAYAFGYSGTTSFGMNLTNTGQQGYDFTLYAPQIAQATSISGTVMTQVSGVGLAGGSMGGHHALATAYDSISLIIASGTTITGTYRVYGLADS